MFFFFSKVFWTVVQPISLVFMLMLLGWLLTLFCRRRAGLVIGLLGLALLGLCSFTTLGSMLISPLEGRFLRPAVPPQRVDTIVMLGGATAGRVSTRRQITELTEAGDRLAETLYLANLYPQARIVLSGGIGSLIADGEPEAETAERFFLAHGIDAGRLMLESASRNTDENAEMTRAMLGDAPGTVMLVTSAFHMPRAMGLFRKVGIEAIAWPVDYRSAGNEGIGIDIANPALNITTTGVAIREWIGLAVYFWTGRIDTPFPAQVSN